MIKDTTTVILSQGDASMHYDEILQLIRQQGYRLTTARKNVVQVLCRHSEYLGAYDIHHILEENNQHVGIVSAYRVIEMLNALGLLQREEFGSGGERFRLLNKTEQHVHQMICTKCGRTKELEDCPIHHLVKSLELQSGYSIQEHWLRFFGLCPYCRLESSDKVI
jgi:Fur family zinc uptake transcriptional regulator/Fur family ferric uptake transcriptional regulator